MSITCESVRDSPCITPYIFFISIKNTQRFIEKKIKIKIQSYD